MTTQSAIYYLDNPAVAKYRFELSGRRTLERTCFTIVVGGHASSGDDNNRLWSSSRTSGWMYKVYATGQ